MKSKLINLTYEIEVQPGDKITLPDSLTESLSPGRWLITIQPITKDETPVIVRSNNAFLNGYAPEDEGLYDDYPLP
ncbi:hypothetical protein [Floridanema evergladense]|uniref:Uncharacterized protein n=1 Tax=Floridaenema evergladense BLCC-F167 TaxID=3153639 RepID=A0ABV4WHX6_9CYAN